MKPTRGTDLLFSDSQTERRTTFKIRPTPTDPTPMAPAVVRAKLSRNITTTAATRTRARLATDRNAGIFKIKRGTFRVKDPDVTSITLAMPTHYSDTDTGTSNTNTPGRQLNFTSKSPRAAVPDIFTEVSIFKPETRQTKVFRIQALPSAGRGVEEEVLIDHE